MDGASLNFAAPWWVYYVLPGGLLVFGALVWASAVLRRRAASLWAGGGGAEGARRVTLRLAPGARWTKLVLAAGALALLCVGLGRPQWGTRTERVPRGGTDLVILVDVSNSMLVEDMGTSRLQWARRKIHDLLDEMSADPFHRVGLMPFAGEPFPLVPPTPDYEAVRFFVDDLTPRSVGYGGSDLARAVDRAAADLKKLPGKRKAILVISDGDAIEPEEPGAVKKAREAARRKAVEAARDAHVGGKGRVVVFALGVGSDKVASEVAVPDERGGRSYVLYKDESGRDRIATSRLSGSTLAEVASRGGGAYVHSTSDDSDINLLMASGLLTGGVTGEEETARAIPIERFRWPLLAAFVLLLVELFVPAGAKGGAGAFPALAREAAR